MGPNRRSNAAIWASTDALGGGTSLRPVFVIDAEIEDVDVELDDARSALDKARSAAENTDRHVEVDSEILHGDPAEAIAESAL